MLITRACSAVGVERHALVLADGQPALVAVTTFATLLISIADAFTHRTWHRIAALALSALIVDEARVAHGYGLWRVTLSKLTVL